MPGFSIPPEQWDVAGHVVKLVNDAYAPGKLVSPNTKMSIEPEEMPRLSLELQRQLGVMVTNEEFATVRTVGDLVTIVARKRAIGNDG